MPLARLDGDGPERLRAMLDRFGAPGFLAAYNAGPERYAAHLATGRPLPRETRAYRAGAAAGRPAATVPHRATPTLVADWRAAPIFVVRRKRGPNAGPNADAASAFDPRADGPIAPAGVGAAPGPSSAIQSEPTRPAMRGDVAPPWRVAAGSIAALVRVVVTAGGATEGRQDKRRGPAGRYLVDVGGVSAALRLQRGAAPVGNARRGCILGGTVVSSAGIRRRDDDLRLRPGRIRDRPSGGRAKGFVGQVLRAAETAGHTIGLLHPSVFLNRSGGEVYGPNFDPRSFKN